ncbi:CYTH and CHAD domain-containing protein [Limimonas halophila]|nr:CYTH and CHAD domain-containing protein [Limimonas halophila]
MTDELELKLALTPADAARVPHLGLIRGLRCGEARSRHLISTYYDTPDLALRRSGMALRIRHDGDGYVQTLKAPAAAKGKHGGLQHMREAETRLSEPVPDLSHLDADLRGFFAADGVGAALRPVFTTTIERTEIPLAVRGGTIELALDQGEVAANGATVPLSEVEFELKAGAPDALHQAARMLTGHVDARLQTRSKAARGYDLFTGDVPAPVKAPKPALTPGMTVAEAFERHAAACLHQIRANIEAVVAGDDPEGVHKLRVGLRRLRAMLDAFEPAIDPGRYAWLRSELRWFQQELGPAREWDVFIAETLAPLRAHVSANGALDEFAATAETLRGEAYARARAAVATGRATGTLLALEAWLGTGAWRPAARGNDVGAADVTAYARETLDTRWKKLRKLGRKHDRLDAAKLHRLRIRGKKLRYTGEAFASLFRAKHTEPCLNRVEALQETLGSLNDAATAERLLAEAHPRLAAASEDGLRTADAATAAVRGWLAAQVDRDTRQLGAAWAAVADAPKFWRKKPAKA